MVVHVTFESPDAAEYCQAGYFPAYLVVFACCGYMAEQTGECCFNSYGNIWLTEDCMDMRQIMVCQVLYKAFCQQALATPTRRESV